MFLTVTMNASIDKKCRIKTQSIGSVNRIQSCEYSAGGKGLNVARVLKLLGERVVCSGMLGGHAGKWIEERLDKEGIPYEFEPIAQETRSCINIIEADGRQTEYLEPGPEIHPGELRKFETRFEALLDCVDYVIISGSTPRGVDDECYARLCSLCHKKGKYVLLDTSGIQLKRGMEAHPTLIKPNLDELKTILGGTVDTDRLPEAAKSLQRQGIKYVVLSQGKSGAIMACPDGVFSCRPPSVPALNATGCGDSMIAGFAYALQRHMPPEQALAFATAVAAANAMEESTGFVRLDNVLRLATMVVPNRII